MGHRREMRTFAKRGATAALARSGIEGESAARRVAPAAAAAEVCMAAWKSD